MSKMKITGEIEIMTENFTKDNRYTTIPIYVNFTPQSAYFLATNKLRKTIEEMQVIYNV